MAHEWELSKENIKPLKSGRRIDQLTLALKQDTAHYKEKIEEFEMQLRILENEDLLEKWFDYIQWVEQGCLSCHNEALSLMKRCVKHFKDKTEFKNVEKFVRIWIKISELIDQPNDIFDYMFNQDIGTSLAIFYKEWAIHNEIIGNTKKADEIFTLGINRNADPVDVLKRKHNEFVWRTSTKSQNDQNEEKNNAVNDAERVAFAPLASTKSGKVNSYRAKTKGRIPLCSVTSSGNNRKVSSSTVFEIFDDDGSGGSNLFPVTSEKRNNLPFDCKGKENAGKVEKMHRTKLKTATSAPNVKPLTFEIFCDTEEAETTIVLPPVNITSRKPLNSITSLIGENNIDIIQDLEKDVNDPKAVHMYPRNKVYMGVNEVSLEELKSQLSKYKKNN